MHLWQNVYTGHEAPNGGVMESWDWSKVAPQQRHPEAEARFYKSRHNRENLRKICGYIILGSFIFLNMISGVGFNDNQLTLSKVRCCSTPTERPCAGCAYQWPLQPLLLLRLKVTHSSICLCPRLSTLGLLHPVFFFSHKVIFLQTCCIHSKWSMCENVNIIIGTDALQLQAAKLVNSNKQTLYKINKYIN